MKKILMFLSAILLIFAVSCSSDNPQPSESGGTAGNNPNAPEVNTGTSQEELIRNFAGRIDDVCINWNGHRS